MRMVGLVIPSYPSEKRVALLPTDILDFPDKLFVEKGFGYNIGISDSEYESRGCVVASRSEIFFQCDTIFALKLLQPDDYNMVRCGQMIIGWVHPTGSGKDFMTEQALPKDLRIVDIDNAYPRLYRKGASMLIESIPRNFLSKNSFFAGFSSTMHAFLSYGAYPSPFMKIAVLGNGNTAQGVFHFLSKFTDNIRMFYRKTLNEFLSEIETFDVIVNGIELDVPSAHLITENDIERCKKGCFFIDAAADAGNTIEGTHYTCIENPIYEKDGRYYYEVNNSPSLIHRVVSPYISHSLAKYVFKEGVDRFWALSETL